jgi:transmembrane sensor
MVMSAERAVREQHEAIQTRAGDLFARRESGEWTAVDERHLKEWLALSPLHRVAFLRLERAWERAGRLKALRTPDGTVPPPGEYVLSPFFLNTSRTRRLGWSWRHYETAWVSTIGVAAALVLITAWLLWPQTSVYRTPVGGLETVPLPDGSIVTLNTESAIRVAETSQERRVTLERGEVFFEVAKDPKRPFVVEAGNKRVIAVGTQFSVWREANDNNIQVVVTEGTVRLEGPAPLLTGHGTHPTVSGNAAPRPGRSGEALLPAGTVAHAGDAGVLVQQASAIDTEQTLSWRHGILVFQDTALGSAVAQFNRYNVRQVLIDDPEVAALKVAGNFRATNVEAFVRLLEKGYPVRIQERGEEIVLEAR